MLSPKPYATARLSWAQDKSVTDVTPSRRLLSASTSSRNVTTPPSSLGNAVEGSIVDLLEDSGSDCEADSTSRRRLQRVQRSLGFAVVKVGLVTSTRFKLRVAQTPADRMLDASSKSAESFALRSFFYKYSNWGWGWGRRLDGAEERCAHHSRIP